MTRMSTTLNADLEMEGMAVEGMEVVEMVVEGMEGMEILIPTAVDQAVVIIEIRTRLIKCLIGYSLSLTNKTNVRNKNKKSKIKLMKKNNKQTRKNIKPNYKKKTETTAKLSRNSYRLNYMPYLNQKKRQRRCM